MREIKRIIIHCSATPPDLDIGAAEIRAWHTAPGWQGAPNGWSDIGYHFVIRRDGLVEPGRPVERVGAHVKGHNADSIGICLVGGVDAAGRAQGNFTLVQWGALQALTTGLAAEHGASVHGHNEFAAKACPSFDVARWWRDGRPAPEGLFSDYAKFYA